MKWIDYDEQEPELGKRLVVKVRMVDFSKSEEDGGPQELGVDVFFALCVEDEFGTTIRIDDDQDYENYPIITHWAYIDK